MVDLRDLQKPIPGPNPSGTDARADIAYVGIEEAQSERLEPWREPEERKKADYQQVIKLASEFLRIKSKNLQVAAWLTQALVRESGFRGLEQGLNLLASLISNFWETLYPRLEDGDARARAGPLKWIASELSVAVKNAVLVGGLDWFRCEEGLALRDHEKNGNGSPNVPSGSQRQQEFSTVLDAAPVPVFEELRSSLDACLAALETLISICDNKFRAAIMEQLRGCSNASIDAESLQELIDRKLEDTAPAFYTLKKALEDVRETARRLLRAREQRDDKKQGQEPEHEERAFSTPATEQSPTDPTSPNDGAKADEDPVQKVIELTRLMRQRRPTDLLPYLLIRALRWGELRATLLRGDSVQLEVPPSDLRPRLKQLAANANWAELLEVAETAVGEPYGGACLDLQEYVVRSCDELGGDYESVSSAVCAELGLLLSAFPHLLQLAFADGKALAGPGTRRWLRQRVTRPAGGRVGGVGGKSKRLEVPEAVPMEQAREAVRAGRAEEAIEILTAAFAREQSGRGRFQRRLELAEICMQTKHEPIACAILEDLVGEIENRGLADWEAPDLLLRPLTMLLQCTDTLKRSPEERRRVYNRICQLDPVHALACLDDV